MDVRLSRHFLLSEFSCKCGNCQTTVEDVDMYLVQQLQRLRDSFGLPIKIASGYRCPEHNKAIGGAKNSQHMQGKAVDISTANLPATERYRLIQLIFRVGAFRGIGIGGGKLHVDVRRTDSPVMWYY